VLTQPGRPLKRASFLPAALGSCSPSRRWANLKPINDDQKTGIDIVRRALVTPAKQIIDNAAGDGAVVIGKLLEAKDYAYEFGAQIGEYPKYCNALARKAPSLLELYR
jgi:chaperonin GroEL (HSP60 family)